MSKRNQNWMLRNFNDFVDNCHELNLTALAESCATHFNDNPDDGNIPEEYFEDAYEVYLKLSKNGVVKKD
jgi:hypothetical protein